MEVFELYDLTIWVDERINSEKHGDLLNHYQNFIHALENSRGGGHSFQDARESLEDVLETISFSSLTNDQTEFLIKYNMLGSLGQKAIKTIEKILMENRLDIAGVIEKVQQMKTHLEEGENKLNAIRDGLADYIPNDYDETHHEEGVLTRLRFCEKASINNIVDFKKAAENWHLIGRGLAEISDAKPEDIKVIGASRGSIIFDLLLNFETAYSFSRINSTVLKNTKTFYEIRKISAELKGIELDNERKIAILKQLGEGEEDEKKKITEQTVAEVTKPLKIADDKMSSLTKAVELISDFLERGGHIDFVLPHQEDDEEENKDSVIKQELSDFRKQVQETRVLIEDIKRIRHIPVESSDASDKQSDDDEGQN